MSYPQQQTYTQHYTNSYSSQAWHSSSSSSITNRFSTLSISSSTHPHSYLLPPHNLECDSYMNRIPFQQTHTLFERLSLNPQQQFPTTAEPRRPSFLLLTDSNGRYLQPFFENPYYSLTTKFISGLSWINPFNPSLCAHSLISSSQLTEDLPNYTRILFLIGTNSIRSTKATVIIDQVEHIIDLIRHKYPHLSHHAALGIIYSLPCYKPSASFPSVFALRSNVDQYNCLLHELSLRKHFSLLDLHVDGSYMKRDGMHVHPSHLNMLWNSILRYFDSSVSRTYSPNLFYSRSRFAVVRRNKKRHEKLRQRQFAQTITRPIASVWKLVDLKNYLNHKQIKYARLPEIYKHQLNIQFHNHIRRQHAEQILSQHDFDELSYYNWIQSGR